MGLGMHPASLYPRRSRIAPTGGKCPHSTGLILEPRSRSVKPFCTFNLPSRPRLNSVIMLQLIAAGVQPMGKARVLALTMIAAVLLPAIPPRAQQPSPLGESGIELRPTNHPRVPADLSQLWLAPSASDKPRGNANEFATAVK